MIVMTYLIITQYSMYNKNVPAERQEVSHIKVL